jgi:hypothetical protein
MCGRADRLDDGAWQARYNYIDDWVHLLHRRDGAVLDMPGGALHLSLAEVFEKYLEPFLRELPSVKTSAHARAEAARLRGEAEYNSWGTAAAVDTESSSA